MATEGALVRQWPLGIDNRSPADQLPEGAVRDLVNLDAGNSLRLRPGRKQKYAAQNTVHGMLSFGDQLLIADGTDLVQFDLMTNNSSVVRQIASTGGMAGDVHNGMLYFCTANESLIFDGNSITQWGVPAPSVQPPAALAPGLLSGAYQLAVTYRNADGVEGGTPAARTVGASSNNITITGLNPPTDGDTCVYMSVDGGATLYFHGATSGSSYTVSTPPQRSNRVLQTQFDTPPPQGHIVRSHRGVLLVADGSVLWMTAPMRPHAVNRMRGFFQYPERITEVVPTPDAVFVGADATYAVSNIELEPRQAQVYTQPIVAGTGVRNEDGTCFWLCEDGYVQGTPGGQIEVITEPRWAPLIAAKGASGKVSIDGRDMMVTTLKGKPRENSLAAVDYFQSEIVRYEP